MKEEEKFLKELKYYGQEVEFLIRFYYTEDTIKNYTKKPKNLVILNKNSLFWNTILGALQKSIFISLGRIFDDDAKHNIHTLLNMAHQNKKMFSKDSFENRWEQDPDRKKCRII